jgi:D-amino peptidase
VRVEVQVLMPWQVERALLMPGMERLDGTTVGYTAPDFATAYNVITLIAVLGGV